MKQAIIIQGKKGVGKSTTIQEVCRKLSPSEIYKLCINEKDKKVARIEEIFNDTFIIKVKEKWILVVAGAPTEQKFNIKVIIKTSIEIGLDISFALVSMRKRERKGECPYNTKEDLKEKGFSIIHIEKLTKVEGVDFKENQNWLDRIDKIVSKIK